MNAVTEKGYGVVHSGGLVAHLASSTTSPVLLVVVPVIVDKRGSDRFEVRTIKVSWCLKRLCNSVGLKIKLNSLYISCF